MNEFTFRELIKDVWIKLLDSYKKSSFFSSGWQ